MFLCSEQIPERRLKPEGLLTAADLQYECASGQPERATQQDRPSEPVSPEDTQRYVFCEIWNKEQLYKHLFNPCPIFLNDKLPRGPNSLSHENELHPTSIVINVTTNIKPCSQKQDNIMQEGQKGFTTEEVLCFLFLVF